MSTNTRYADATIPFASTAVFSSPYAMLNEKLLAQLQHYLRTGEAFDTARAAIDDGTVHITRRPFMLNEEEVTNTSNLTTAHAYNAESYNDSLNALYLHSEFSQDINMVAIIGLLCSVLVTSSETTEYII